MSMALERHGRGPYVTNQVWVALIGSSKSRGHPAAQKIIAVANIDTGTSLSWKAPSKRLRTELDLFRRKVMRYFGLLAAAAVIAFVGSNVKADDSAEVKKLQERLDKATNEIEKLSAKLKDLIQQKDNLEADFSSR